MLQEKHWNYLVDQLTYLQQMAELNQRLLQVTARQGKLHLVGGYVHGRNSKDVPFIILYSPSGYMDHKICRVYREQFNTLPDYIDTKTPTNVPDDNPTKTQAKKQGIYKTCKFFTIATYEGKETQMGKEIRYMITVYVGKPPDPKGGMFRADLIQNRSLQAPAPEWPQKDEILLSDMGTGMTRSHDEPPETQEEYDERHKEEAAKAAITDALTAQRKAAKERVDQLNKKDYPIPGGYPTAEEEGQFIEDTVGDSYDEVIDLKAEGIAIRKPDTPEPTTYLAELNKEPKGVTLSQAKEIQEEHQKLDEEDYQKGVYEGEKTEIIVDEEGDVHTIIEEPPKNLEAPVLVIKKEEQVSTSEGPSQEDVDTAVAQLKAELESPEMAKALETTEPVPEKDDEPIEQTDIQKNTTEFIQDHMEHLPPAIRQELLNQQLFPQHDIDPKPEQPYKYKNGELLSDSPFVNALYDVYYEIHNKYPPSAEALQLWYVSEDMGNWLKEAHHVTWISQEHDNKLLLLLKE